MRPLLILILVLVFTPMQTHAFKCPSGGESHPATAEEAANSSSITTGVTQVCPEDVRAGISTDAGSAKEYLYSIATKVNTADREHIQNLNSSFAICSATFLKAYTQRYGSVTITSAWRSGADQRRVSTALNSNHTKGLALDTHPASGDYDSLMNFAIANPQFGVCYARPTYNGKPDLPHMTAAGIGSVTENCSKYGITKMCEAGHFDPSTVRDANTAPRTPSSFIRDYLSPENQSCSVCREDPDNYNACMQCSSGSNQPRTGAVPASGSQPAGGSAGGGSPQTSGSSGSAGQQPVSSALGGSTGQSTPAATTNTGSTIASLPTPTETPNPVSSLLDTPDNSSAFNLINALANPTTTVTAKTSATGSPLALSTSTQTDIAGIGTSGSGQSNGNAANNQHVSTLNPWNQQTFVSEDLRGDGTTVTSGGTFQNNTFLINILSSLKQILLKFLEIIRPFQGIGYQGGEE